MKKLRYLVEAGTLWIAFLVFGLMGPDKASACGGWIGRKVGPRLGASNKAMDNLVKGMPGLTERQYTDIISDMWDNLGRVIAEYPHLTEITKTRIEIVGHHHLNDMIGGKPGILIGAHHANWEIPPFYFYTVEDWPVACVYRAPNNPYVERLLERCRNTGSQKLYIRKSQRGAKDIVTTLKNNGCVAILIDQKYNQGIPVEFFGRPAMTTTGFAQLAKRYHAPVVPLRIERTKGCRFKITLYPPMVTNGREDEDIVLEANRILEGWVREKPAEWLWLHRRWSSKAVKDLESVVDNIM